MNNHKTQALWDTGAQVSIMSKAWRSSNLPDFKVHPINELLSSDELLDLRAVNGSEIAFQGWVEVSLSLSDPKGKVLAQDEVLVPILVSHDVVQKSIIGFNAIEELLKQNPTQHTDQVLLLGNSLKVGSGKAEALLNLIHTAASETATYRVRSEHKAVVVPSGQMHCVRCPFRTYVKVRTEMLFEPDENLALDGGLKFNCQLLNVSSTTCKAKIYVTNTTKHDIVLAGKTCIGTMERMVNCYPVNLDQCRIGLVIAENSQNSLCSPEKLWEPPVDLGHLTSEQQLL